MRKIYATIAVGLMMVIAPLENVQAATHDVTVAPGGSIVFSPADIAIDIGDTVRWTWASTGHNVRSGLPGAPTNYFLSGAPAPAGTIFEFTFDQAFLNTNPEPGNLYPYHCEPHGIFGMVGSITVVPEPGTVAMCGLIAAIPLLRRRRAR